MSVKNKISAACDHCQNVPIIGSILKPKPKVAVVRMSGVIADSAMKRGGISYQRFERALEDAFDLYNTKAVALVINSPGGSPAQSQLIGGIIRELAEDKDIPVIAFVEDVAASGGYWLACAADEIYAVPSSIIGSIGVISAGFGMQELIAKYGVERRLHTSGKDKSFLDPFMEEKPADVKRLTSLQKDLHGLFIDWVKERRGKKISGDDKTLFEGAFWSAVQALDYGLIDGLGQIKEVCKSKYGEDVKFIDLSPGKGLVSSIVSSDAKLGIAEDAIETLETKTVWARYGL